MAFKPTHVVDTSAAIAYLKGEEGADVFANLLLNESNIFAMHAANAVELYYLYLGTDGFDTAEAAWDRLLSMVTIAGNFDDQFVKRVARWKVVRYPGQGGALPLGDCFAAATAEEHGCPLLTTDHGDFDPIATAGALSIVWLR
jgi:uncharacterized protein with PIN domain